MDYGVPQHQPLASASSLSARHLIASRADRPSPEVLFVTNRGPVEHRVDAEGVLCAERGAGGVVSGLLCAAQGRRVTWISLAMSEADRVAARQAPSRALCPADLPNVTSRLVAVPQTTYCLHYDGFSNRVLWFLQHDLALDGTLTRAQLETSWREGYLQANLAVANAVTTEILAGAQGTETPPIVFHDYHLYLAPALVRQRLPDARLQHFVHIPWPSPRAWDRLPAEIVRRIYAGLASNDVIGFQTARDVRNFLAGVARYLPDAVRTGAATLCWHGRDVRVAAYPIAVTRDAIVAQATTPHAEAAAAEILNVLHLDRGRDRSRKDEGRKLILRVDRVEPTKNIVVGFEAYERLLEENAGLREQVVFLALLVPSRERLPIYRRYAEEVQRAIDRVNARFATPGWQPIVAVYGNDHARALACMRRYDVLLVNPLIDGMNLVVKEGAILNERGGAIVLSTEAGAYAQLEGGVIPVAPGDLAATSAALRTALTLSDAPREALAARARHLLRAESAASWLEDQMADLATVTAPRLRAVSRDRRTALSAEPHVDLDLLAGLEESLMLHLPIRDGGRDTVPLA
jgi:trehalose 6-phosphate synthase